MRTAIAAAASLLFLAACSDNPPATVPDTRSEVINTGSAPAATTSPAPKILTWGDSGTSSGVDIQLGQPAPDPEPTDEGRYVAVPVTVDNKSAGSARMSFAGRVGQQEAPWTDSGDVGEFLPGERGTMRALFRVPPGVSGDLVVEAYATVDGGMATNRLTFRGPLPPAA